MKIPVLHILPGLDTGGTEMVLSRLLKTMDAEIFRHSVVSMKEEGVVGARIREMGIQVYSLGLRKIMNWVPAIKDVAGIVRECDPRIIQGWLYHGNMAATTIHKITKNRAALAWNIRQALYDIQDETKEIRSLIRAGIRFSRRPEVIIYNSETGMQQHESAGYDQQNSVVIHNGFDTEIFRPSPEARKRARSLFGIGEDITTVGLGVRYSPVKDFGNFLQAAAMIKQTHDQVMFVCAGPGIEWTNEELKRRITKAGVEENIILLGNRVDIQDILPGLDIMVLSSRSEGFPNIIGEAMACGVPCVATEVGDTAALIGNAGSVVEPANPYALADSVRDYIDLGAMLRGRRGEMAREHIIENFPIQKMTRQYEMVYRNAIQNQ